MKKNRNGFTLVECIVAVSVISVITAAAIGIYQTAQHTAVDQWDGFLATVMADNALADFQNADSMEEFENGLDGLVQIGSQTEKTVDLTVDRSYYEYDLANAQIPCPFDRVRAYESGRVSVLDSAGQDLVTFDYGGKTAGFSSDTAILTKADGIYQKDGESRDAGGITSLTVDNRDDYKVTYTNDKVKFENTLQGSGEFDITPLEKYLLSQGYFLHFADNTDTDNPIWNGDYRYFYFYVYERKQNGNVQQVYTDKNHYLTLRIKYDSKGDTPNSNDKSSWNKTKKIHVTEVKFAEIYETSNWSIDDGDYRNDYKDANGNGFSDFYWGGMPFFAYYCAGEKTFYYTPHIEDKNTQITVTQGAGGLVYTDYVIKPDAGIVSQIDHALSKNGELQLIGDHGTLLYDFLGEVTGALGQLRANCHFASKNDTDAADGFRKHRALTEGIELTGVYCDDGNKKIVFYQDDIGKPILSFVYAAAEQYDTDKNAINGVYRDFYDPSGKLKVTGEPIIHRIEGDNIYQLVIRSVKEDIIVFTSHGGTVQARVPFSDDDFQMKVKRSTVSGSAVTRCYIYVPNNGNYGCYIVVTYSDTVSADLSVEPRIRIWILPKKELPTDTAAEPVKKCYLSYRKG